MALWLSIFRSLLTSFWFPLSLLPLPTAYCSFVSPRRSRVSSRSPAGGCQETGAAATWIALAAPPGSSPALSTVPYRLCPIDYTLSATHQLLFQDRLHANDRGQPRPSSVCGAAKRPVTSPHRVHLLQFRGTAAVPRVRTLVPPHSVQWHGITHTHRCTYV